MFRRRRVLEMGHDGVETCFDQILLRRFERDFGRKLASIIIGVRSDFHGFKMPSDVFELGGKRSLGRMGAYLGIEKGDTTGQKGYQLRQLFQEKLREAR